MNAGVLLRLSLPVLLSCGGLALAAPDAPGTRRLDATASVTLGYDDDVYAIDAGPLANIESGFATAAARLAATISPGASVAYAPAVTRFFDQPLEDNVKQVLSLASKGRHDSLSWNAAAEFAHVDGDDRGVDYGSGCGNAFSTVLPRERRDQWQHRADLALRHDSSPGFVRGVGRLLYWDMLTAPAGSANYVDRHDINGGVDLGRPWKNDGPDLYLGYRHGYQFQDRDAKPSSPRHASNHYDRAFLGLDGRLGPALTLSAQAGWARHHYPADPATYAGSAHEEGLFTDITLVWTVTDRDELQFKTAQGRTFSTTGANSILSTTHQLSWKHVFDRRWSATLAGRFSEAEYSPFPRDDFDTAVLASLACKIDDRWTCTLSASRDWGREHHNEVSGFAETLREFDRATVSLGVTCKL